MLAVNGEGKGSFLRMTPENWAWENSVAERGRNSVGGEDKALVNEDFFPCSCWVQPLLSVEKKWPWEGKGASHRHLV